MSDLVYVSITGLQVRRPWHLPVFWRHATASMAQAQRAPGCLEAAARTIGGVHHTRSVWRDRSDMLAYVRSGAHLAAMKAFHQIATGKTVGFTTADIPDWDEAHRLWVEEGIPVQSLKE